MPIDLVSQRVLRLRAEGVPEAVIVGMMKRAGVNLETKKESADQFAKRKRLKTKRQ